MSDVLRNRRAHVVVGEATASGPPHCPRFTAQAVLKTKANPRVAVFSACAGRKKDAKNDAKNKAIDAAMRLPDPCPRGEMEMSAFFGPLRVEAFGQDPGWFVSPQVVGVDFEGMKPVRYVQIACDVGVVVHHVHTGWVQRVLRDRRHVHAIFGDHEAKYVANPRDMQTAAAKIVTPPHTGPWSLADAVSIIMCPEWRITKDKSFARSGCFSQDARDLTEDEVMYAAMDAHATRAMAQKLGVK